ncbi:MAG: translation initiation factor IF-3 [Verrucomicrobiales bacterium]
MSSKPQNRFQPRRDFGPRVNDRIRAPKIRVIDGASGAQLGVMSAFDALQIARQRGLDLVEIAANAQPPVCKIIDFGKWKYEQAKHEKEKHKTKASKVKEVKLRVGIDPHDYKIKLTRAEDFLMHNDKLRVVLQFKGRQMAHPEIGMQLMHKVIEDLKGSGHPDMMPRQAGKMITMAMSPHPSQQRVRKFRAQDAVVDMSQHADEDDDDDDEDEDDRHEGNEEANAAVPHPPEKPVTKVKVFDIEALDADKSLSSRPASPRVH